MKYDKIYTEQYTNKIIIFLNICAFFISIPHFK